MSATSHSPAEQHLGDRLAALVDGELDHDARERVQAHLATCAKCKAEADAQRRLKSVFAQTAPPPPSAGLLARLQGLPGGPPKDDGDQDRDDGRGMFDGGGFGEGVFGVRRDSFTYVPAAAPADVVPGSGSGFRIHEVGRQEAERSPWRGRRFAFAAASAVSFAAMALGGTMPLGTAADAMPRGAGNNVTPMRAPGTTNPVSVTTEAARRQGQGGTRSALQQSVDRAVGGASPGMLQAQTLASVPSSSAVLTLRPAAPLMTPPDAALQIGSASATAPAATPTVPVPPLSSPR